jgi:hypothetical protein
MFFTKHPFITQTDKNGNSVQVTDIFSTLKSFEVYKNTQYSIPYYVREGDTPESIAKKMYDRQSLSWIILLVNNIKNVYNDWPLSSQAFDSYINKKYGSLSSLFLKLDSIKNYDINKGDIIIVAGNPNKKAEVIEWNASLSKLVIKIISGSFAINDSISFLNNGSFIGKVGRVNNYEQESLHHFELNGIYLDPLTGYLQGYINGISNNVITNYEYETKLNDNKRYIYLPLPTIATRIEQEYAKLMAV